MYRFIVKSYNRFFSSHRNFVNQIRSVTGITPVSLNLYKVAFTHSSLEAEVGRNNERLELLGDAVFDLVVSEYIYKRYPYKDEGFLSEMRSKIVSRSQINSLAYQIGIGHLLEASMPNRKMRNSSTLGNAFEAMLGALYLDHGYRITHRYIYNQILAIHFDLAVLEETTINFKSAFIHYCQKHNRDFEFKLLNEHTTKRGRIFTIGLYLEGEMVSKASDMNKKGAEQMAAEEAIKILNIKDDLN